MAWTGKLRIANGVASLQGPQPPNVPDPVRLAIQNGIPNPLVAAKNTLVNNGFVNNEAVLIAGQSGLLGNVTVIFMTAAHHGAEIVHTLISAGVSLDAVRELAMRSDDATRATAKAATTGSAAAKSDGEESDKKVSHRKEAKSASKRSAKATSDKTGRKNQ